MSKIELRNLVKKYDKNEVLHSINLTINHGEFMVLVGPSGCAKSTTLRMIAGLEDISSGEILVDDEIINNIPPQKRDIALVFQNYALYPHMTVYENMAFALKIRKINHKIIDEKIKLAAKELEIEELLNRKPSELSGGQKQRVALGRSIVRNPKIFLFDEPLSNLDAKLRVAMRIIISKLHKNIPNSTMVYVTHDQTEAMTMGDRICVMDKGNIMQVDTPSNIYNNPKNKFVASFIGSPSMNFIKGKIIKEDENLYFYFNDKYKLKLSKEISKNLDENYINEFVILGIRPKDIKISKEIGYKAQIEMVENLGSQKYIYLKLDSLDLIAISFNEDIKENIKIMFDMEKICIFDIKTEENLLYKKEN